MSLSVEKELLSTRNEMASRHQKTDTTDVTYEDTVEFYYVEVVFFY